MKRLDFKNIKLLVLDFDGVFTDNRVLVDENGKESVFCNRGDGLGLELLKNKPEIKQLNRMEDRRWKSLREDFDA